MAVEVQHVSTLFGIGRKEMQMKATDLYPVQIFGKMVTDQGSFSILDVEKLLFI